MSRAANERIPDLAVALIRRIDSRNLGIDDGVASTAPPIRRRDYLQLGLVAVGRCAREVRETALEGRRSAVHVLDQIGEGLGEVAGAELENVGMEVRHDSDFRGVDPLGPEIGASYSVKRGPKLVERRRVERSAERGANAQC